MYGKPAERFYENTWTAFIRTSLLLLLDVRLSVHAGSRGLSPQATDRFAMHLQRVGRHTSHRMRRGDAPRPKESLPVTIHSVWNTANDAP